VPLLGSPSSWSSSPSPPSAPWRLVGECVVAWARPRSSVGLALADGVRRLGGLPAVVVAASYEASPVGPYRELAVGVPARVGLRPGLSVVLSVVDNADARAAYRQEWALPTELGKLRWSTSAARIVVSWLDAGLELDVAAPGRLRVPVALPARTLQRRADGPVVLPRWLRGFVRPARLTVAFAAADAAAGPGPAPTIGTAAAAATTTELAWLTGSHRGVVVSSMRVAAAPARQPTGLLSSLRAPHPTTGAAEPALTSPAQR
jgi:hypothetical protein